MHSYPYEVETRQVSKLLGARVVGERVALVESRLLGRCHIAARVEQDRKRVTAHRREPNACCDSLRDHTLELTLRCDTESHSSRHSRLGLYRACTAIERPERKKRVEGRMTERERVPKRRFLDLEPLHGSLGAGKGLLGDGLAGTSGMVHLELACRVCGGLLRALGVEG